MHFTDCQRNPLNSSVLYGFIHLSTSEAQNIKAVVCRGYKNINTDQVLPSLSFKAMCKGFLTKKVTVRELDQHSTGHKLALEDAATPPQTLEMASATVSAPNSRQQQHWARRLQPSWPPSAMLGRLPKSYADCN